tara:strand:+ start:1221 stop:1556 length:336 start_codon:yes stop_codon:yes gene_type:complete
MPHSVSPEEPSNADASPSAVAEISTIDAMTQETSTENGNSQDSEAADHDMTMADVAGTDTIPGALVKPEIKSEVKLEDLFADMDSDEEFPSSTGQKLKITSSPPEAPPSPV